jgi:hypothetical protein
MNVFKATKEVRFPDNIPQSQLVCHWLACLDGKGIWVFLQSTQVSWYYAILYCFFWVSSKAKVKQYLQQGM